MNTEPVKVTILRKFEVSSLILMLALTACASKATADPRASSLVTSALRLGLKTKNFGLWGTLRWIVWALYFSCSPFPKIDRSNALHRRARPSNPVVNFGIIVAAVGWNMLHLPETMQIRKAEQARVLQARQYLDQRYGTSGPTPDTGFP